MTCLDYDVEADALIAAGPEAHVILVKDFFNEADRLVLRSSVPHDGFSDVLMLGGCVFAGGWDGKYGDQEIGVIYCCRIRLFERESLKPLGLLNVHCDTVLSLSSYELKDGIKDARRPSLRHHHTLLATSGDRTLSLWSLDVLRQCHRL